MTRPVLLLDVMSTLVYDPFMVEMPAFFGLTLEEMFRDRHPTAWVEFELGEIDQETFFAKFFKGGREVDHQGFREMLHGAYRFLPGVEELLAELSEAGAEMHTLSNYPDWWRIIESSVGLSRYVDWTVVSCEVGVRKPDAGIYTRAAELVSTPPERCLFVDDREKNCDGARSIGMQAVRFEDAAQLRRAFLERGVL